ncbi:putative toxin-antitoxin system, toxin component [Leptospira meyeri serovar Semaranga str. Veldrot Semarang 173]|nr:putative toxin-antitoxin system, toxin component [Leptospira meyeri serovar Semaranga str. Veldrot Semarang 173]
MHSTESEERFFCFGLVNEGIITVRFTLRGKKIRIYGAGFWREGKKLYEKENKLH